MSRLHAFIGLGAATLVIGDYAPSRAAYCEALAVARERQALPKLLETMSGMARWHTITSATDPYLDTLTDEILVQPYIDRDGKPPHRIIGNMLQRVIYHYWYHTRENMAIRQMLGIQT